MWPFASHTMAGASTAGREGEGAPLGALLLVLTGQRIVKCSHFPPTPGGNQRPLGARRLCLQSYSLVRLLVVAA